MLSSCNNNITSNLINTDNLFNKELKALKKHCPQTYKYLIFKFQPFSKDGIYEENLPTSKEFKFVYGQIKIKYEVRNGIAYYQNLEPSQFFIDSYKFELDAYKGIYYRNNRDKFMIDLFFTLKKKGIM